MEVFQLWYAYYDSIFTSFPIQIPYPLIDNIILSQNLQIPWPQTKKLPQLSECFSILQKFILDQNNWVESNCDNNILQEIQVKINFILTLLLIEKTYGKDYWSNSKRRIQASIAHFFLILKNFIYCLIPQNFNTLSDSIKNQKSCTSLINLQILMNSILEKMQKLRQFILGKQFKEERNLVNQFLLQIKDFLQNLPFYSKKKLQSIPQLIKYIQIINPIELSKDSYQIRLKRKKANTYDNNTESLKIKNRQYTDNIRTSQFSLAQNNSYFIPKCNSTHLLKNHDFFTEEIQIQHKKKQPSYFLNVFKFNEIIRKHSVNYGKKKATITSLTTKQQRDQSNQRKGSVISQSKYDRLRSKQKSTIKLKTSSITMRSKQSSQYMILHQNIQKQNENQRKLIECIKKSQKKNGNLKFQNIKFNVQFNFANGKPKQWGIVRDYVNKNIAKKKIQQLFNQQVNF